MEAPVLHGSSSVTWTGLPGGVTTGHVHFGRDEVQVGAIQIGVATASGRPTVKVLHDLWKTRGKKSPMGFVVATVAADGVWLYYPSSGDQPSAADVVGPVSASQAARQLQSVLDEPQGLAAHGRMRAIVSALATGDSAGYSNHFLFATYHLQRDVPARSDWSEAAASAQDILDKRGRDLVHALGFASDDSGAERVLVLRTADHRRRAVAVLLREDEHFDRRSSTYQLTPVAKALEVAGAEDVPWVIALSKSTLRLYPGRDGVGVGQRGQSETYFELDLDLLDPEQSALLALVFSAAALEPGGSTEQILEGSARYAADLGERLRDRVYEGVVPRLALAIADQLPAIGLVSDADGLQTAYRLSMRVLFRLLFQAYGESTGLLPAGRNPNYDHNSLQNFLSGALHKSPEEFSTESTAAWADLQQVWGVIFTGNGLWDVPAYGGSLFDPATDEGALIKRLELTDSTIGPALQQLLSEITPDGVRGQVDFRSLQVREFGTIYEGLLESSLSLAEQDLATDVKGAYVPAKDGQPVVAPVGRPYFHSASGERKATGSYYTPKLIVDHLIERSVTPALAEHLDRVRALLADGKDRQAADAFFDFRVADLAMGSAHFLVAAVDKIERGMRDFLTTTEVPGVRAELTRLAETARAALGADTEAAQSITDGQLLRRQVARRCIYGLDINPLAVELSQLALWIHTFVPGLPMSSLDHGLVLANSLTGIGTIDEAMGALHADGLFEQIIREPLEAARELLVDYAGASEADKSEVKAGAAMLEKARVAAAPAKAIFDVAVARRLGVVAGDAWDADQFVALAATPEVRDAVEPLQPAHLPFLFPEVFLRDRPGFDVLVGNPPWEKVKVEEHQWWGMRIPGLRSMPQAKKKLVLTGFRIDRPDMEVQYAREIAATDAYRAVLVKGPFPGVGSGGDPDLYQAFAWRFWQLTREGGRSANVLPRGALSGSALAKWRREVLEEGSFVDVCFLLNNQQWVFPNVHPQYTVGLTVIERGGERVARFSGPFASEKEFVAGADTLAEVVAEEFASWSASAAFPLIPDPESAQVFAQMKRSPRFADPQPDWEFRPMTEFHATADKKYFDFEVAAPAGDQIRVLAGAAFTIWEPDFGTPYAYADRVQLRNVLATKVESAVRSRRSPYFGLDFSPDALPMDRPRIAFRDITRATDTRTALACLLPPGVVTVHNAPLLVTRAGGARAEAYTVGVMSSIPFDWAARRWVELHLTFELLNMLPMPIFRPGSPVSDRIVEIASRLAAVDHRYENWARETGVAVGTACDSEIKLSLTAELDALVAVAFELTRKQLEHVFATFHRGWDYGPRLERVLEYYEQWKDAA